MVWVFVFYAKFRQRLWALLFRNFIWNKLVSPLKTSRMKQHFKHTFTLMGSQQICHTLTEIRKTDTNKCPVNAQPISSHTTFFLYPSFHFSGRSQHDDIWMTTAMWGQHSKVKGWATFLLETRHMLSHPVTLQYTHALANAGWQQQAQQLWWKLYFGKRRHLDDTLLVDKRSEKCEVIYSTKVGLGFFNYFLKLFLKPILHLIHRNYIICT